jgi:hypothetical protein
MHYYKNPLFPKSQALFLSGEMQIIVQNAFKIAYLIVGHNSKDRKNHSFWKAS